MNYVVKINKRECLDLLNIFAAYLELVSKELNDLVAIYARGLNFMK